MGINYAHIYLLLLNIYNKMGGGKIVLNFSYYICILIVAAQMCKSIVI